MIKPLRYDDGKLVKLSGAVALNATIAKFDALAYSGGYLQRATNATTEVRFMAMEGITASSSIYQDILVLNLDGVECEADTNTDPVIATDIGKCADLTDHDTIDESTNINKVFFITQIVGATTDKKVRGYFVTKYL